MLVEQYCSVQVAVIADSFACNSRASHVPQNQQWRYQAQCAQRCAFSVVIASGTRHGLYILGLMMKYKFLQATYVCCMLLWDCLSAARHVKQLQQCYSNRHRASAGCAQPLSVFRMSIQMFCKLCKHCTAVAALDQ